MPLRIACDLDGTLADMDAALQREAEHLFGPGADLRGAANVAEAGGAGQAGSAGGPEVANEDVEAWPKPDPANGSDPDAASERLAGRTALTGRQMRQLWRHVRSIENFWTTLEEIEAGAVARLAALAGAHGWEVIFLTQRPPTAGETAQRQTQRWLAARGFELPPVYVMNGSRGKVADALALDAVLDDRPENCLDVATDSRARPILIWRDSRETVPAATARFGITVVSSFAEALDELQQIALAKPPGLVARLRGAIGI